MEQHGINPEQNVTAVIPARLSSTRLPEKLLRLIAGKPLIIYTIERALQASLIKRVIVATDDERILKVVHDAGYEAVMTSPEHESGTDRIAEVALGLPDKSIIVNVQGDEPLISPLTIDSAIRALVSDPTIDIATAAEPIGDPSELSNPNVVKVVVSDSGIALYFSRSLIPFPRDASLIHGGDAIRAIIAEPALLANFRKHAGLYVYRREYLLEFAKMPQSHLEKIEMLEQLRALENGAKIKIVEAAGKSVGVDTAEDLERVARIIEENSTAVG